MDPKRPGEPEEADECVPSNCYINYIYIAALLRYYSISRSQVTTSRKSIHRTTWLTRGTFKARSVKKKLLKNFYLNNLVNRNVRDIKLLSIVYIHMGLPVWTPSLQYVQFLPWAEWGWRNDGWVDKESEEALHIRDFDMQEPLTSKYSGGGVWRFSTPA